MIDKQALSSALPPILDALRRRWRLVAIMGLLPSLFVGLHFLRQSKIYEVNAVLNTGWMEGEAVPGLADVSVAVSNDHFFDQVIHRLPWLESSNIRPAELRAGMLDIQISVKYCRINLRARADKPEHAVDLARTVTEMILPDFESKYQAGYEFREREIKAMELRLKNLTVNREKLTALLVHPDPSVQSNPLAMVILNDSLDKMATELFPLMRDLNKAKFRLNAAEFTARPGVAVLPFKPANLLPQRPASILLFTLLGSLLAAVTVVVMFDA